MAGLWRREDTPGTDESWVESGQTSIRAIRGLPLGVEAPQSVQAESAAYREQLCATGPCVEKGAELRRYVGGPVREARGPVRHAENVGPFHSEWARPRGRRLRRLCAFAGGTYCLGIFVARRARTSTTSAPIVSIHSRTSWLLRPGFRFPAGDGYRNVVA